MADETQPDVQAQAPAVPAAPDPTPAPEATPAAEASSPSTAPPDAPSQPAPAAAPAPEPAAADPVTVDNLTRRDDSDALEGHFAKVVDGEHTGQIGVFSHVVEYDPQTGYPSVVLLDFRDHTYAHDKAQVPYSAIVPAAPYLGGR